MPEPDHPVAETHQNHSQSGSDIDDEPRILKMPSRNNDTDIEPPPIVEQNSNRNTQKGGISSADARALLNVNQDEFDALCKSQ